MRRRFIIAIAALVLLSGAFEAQALQLQPMEVTLEASGSGSTAYFTVRNSTAKQIPVQLAIYKREIGPDGKDILTDASEQMRLLPAQVILQPNQSRRIRLQWVGGQPVDKELAFRLIAEQVPVDLEKPDPAEGAGGKVKFLLRYVGSVYVAPKGAKAGVAFESVASVEALPEGHGVVRSDEEKEAPVPAGPLVKLVVTNPGTKHELLPVLALKLVSKGAGGKETSVEVPAERLQGLVGENMLAGGTRHFYLPWPAGLEPGELSAQWVEAPVEKKKK